MDEETLIPPLALDDPALRDFTIERELGGGGMSRLFMAFDRRLDRRVVIKILAPTLAETLSVDRFQREILLVTSLQHPNIVPVLSAGEIGSAPPLPFFVMPYIEGEALRERLLRGPLSVREAVNIARDVARALSFAHERGVVHRDIKPGNILLSSGAAQVSDFGVAKALSVSRRSGRHGKGDEHESGPQRVVAATSLTAIGTSLGTPAYMAPEQAAADPGVNHRADIYALGVVLYEMLAGTPPFHGRSPQDLLRAQLADPPPPLAARRYDVPARLAELVDQCLEKDPARRPKSTAEVLRRLEDPEVLSGQFAMLPVARKRSRRALVARASIGAALVAVVGGTLFYALQDARLRAQEDTALPAAFPAAGTGGGAVAPAGPGAPAGTAPVSVPRALAIGPITAVGGDARAAAVVEGLGSELATTLATVPAVRVRTRGADSTAGLLRLIGTVQQERSQLRVLLRVVDTGADSTLWAATFDGSADSLLALQSRVARGAATSLGAVLARP